MNNRHSTLQILVADIGGTHARFALAAHSETDGMILSELRVLDSGAYPSLAAVTKAYLNTLDGKRPDTACLALAGPVRGARAHLTNLGWSADSAELEATLGFSRVTLINDFGALARAVPHLEAHEIQTIKHGTPDPHGPISVMGAGTGFGLSLLIPRQDVWDLVATEGGHQGFAPETTFERRLWDHLSAQSTHVSVERVLSGAGLSQIHAVLAAEDGATLDPIEADVISRAAEAGDERAIRALECFCDIFGSVAGNIALTQGATGGIYLAGGVLEKNPHMLEKSAFVRRFRDKEAMADYLDAIPVCLIRSPYAALKGAALWVKAGP
jgi:glucokinase